MQTHWEGLHPDTNDVSGKVLFLLTGSGKIFLVRAKAGFHQVLHFPFPGVAVSFLACTAACAASPGSP